MVLGPRHLPSLRRPKWLPLYWSESHHLQEFFNRIANTTFDPLFVSIDFDGAHHFQQIPSENFNYSVGLAILDTRETYIKPSTELIKTHYFIAGSAIYQRKCQKSPVFGGQIIHCKDDMVKNIASLIPKDRCIIILGHDLNLETTTLKILGFDFSAYDITFFDTQKIFSEMTLEGQSSLRFVLEAFNCHYKNLHCAGNDANFILRALLLLALKSFIPQFESDKELTAVMRDVASTPLASTWQPSKEKMKMPRRIKDGPRL